MPIDTISVFINQGNKYVFRILHEKIFYGIITPMRQGWIKQQLGGLNKTQSGLANALDLASPRISEIIKGTRKLQIEEVIKLAHFLEMEAADVLARVMGDNQYSPEAHIGNTPDLLPEFSHDVDGNLPQEPLTGKPVNGILELGVSASSGGGAVVLDEPELGVWRFPQIWVQSELRATAQELRIITIEGDSMSGVLKSGDKVIVHIARTQPSPPGIFILFDGLGLVAKRLEFLEGSDPPTVRISSSNPSYPPYERTVDEIKIVGRVVGRWERL